MFTIGLNDRLNDMTNILLEEKVIPCSIFKFLAAIHLMETFWMDMTAIGMDLPIRRIPQEMRLCIGSR